jgi:zinc D-Ala-D-Ala carboxypeptidase
MAGALMPVKLSPHFSSDEIACRHCAEVQVDARLLASLEELRLLVKRPIHITSGYRCPEYNSRIGGEKGSLHCLGRAADIVCAGMSTADLFRQAEKVPGFALSGIGLYPDEGFIHVDVGRVKPARWARLKEKGYVSILEGMKHAKAKT